MAPGTRLHDLLLQWEQSRAEGRPLSPEELCRDCPELIEEVRRQIGLLERAIQEPDAGRSTLPSRPIDFNRAVPAIAPAGAAVAEALPPRFGRYRVIAMLGHGSFGVVYRGYDDELHRDVAVKVPRQDAHVAPEDAQAFLAEGQTLACLDHPHIVPVFDVGRTSDGLCFVVSKFIEGSDLARVIRNNRPSLQLSAELLASIADALHHAHKNGLVHRDIKPANILIDLSGRAYVADFGLALKEEDYGKEGGLCGTPAYMSPEQASGEGHRVDGRSDIFSLGVVLYELLAGRRPFRGDASAVIRQILDDEPRPPRQIDDGIPRELERICLKALSKKASDRYTTARDMADELRHWREHATIVHGPLPPAVQAPQTAAPGTPSTSYSEQRTKEPAWPIKIVPKGLRSFDAGDADFFLELLPGPRDRDGLPESIRFWKLRIEATEPDNTFAVALIYGPSGCGKSSLVKAGLLSRLPQRVTAIYLEATAAETEARLLNGLRRQVPDLVPPDLGLIEALTALRRGRFLEPDQKVLLVLDQFEQWLHAKRGEAKGELVSALRQCDGLRVQALVMVRDDFWMAATRFMAELEISLVQGQNCAAVDLFDLLHARKVFHAFGAAYGRLPEPGKCTRENEAFLDQAVASLAQDGKVNCVRLALFADMIKGKSWTPATLKEIGGMAGVGVTFLEETFSAPTAPPQHRLHQKAAQAVLRSLLPQTGTDIKGNMQSQHQLLEASGYPTRAGNFDDLLRILDSELRLITPSDTEGMEGEGWRVTGGKNDGGAELSATGRVAVRHGTGGEVLSGHEEFSESGVVRSDKSDPASVSVGAGEHRRGPGEGPHEGVSAPPGHCPGIAHGSGNALAAEPESRIAGAGRPGELAGADRPNQPHAHRPAQSPPKKALLIPFLPATHHPPDATRFYQLTHDYLVPSLREWLYRKQKQTRRGRAEIRLAERAAAWNARPERRNLPAWWEWLNIRMSTRRRDWSGPQREMMRHAHRYHALRGLALLLIVGAIGWAGYETYGTIKAHGLRDRLMNAATETVPDIIADLSPFRRWVDPLLRHSLAEAEARNDSSLKLRASLALLPVDESLRDYVYERLLEAEPNEVPVLRAALLPHKDNLLEGLWQAAQKNPRQRLRAACALAAYSPDHPRWASIQDAVGNDLVGVPAVHLGAWLESLRPVSGKLLAPLAEVFRDRERRETERSLATDILADYASDRPDFLAGLLLDADAKQFAPLFARLQLHRDAGRATLEREIVKKPPVERAGQAPKDAELLKVQGTIGKDDEKVHISHGKKALALPAKVHKVKLQAGRKYAITTTVERDGFVVLQDKAGKQLAFDDDNGSNADGRLHFTPPRDDVYMVYAATSRETTAYSLAISDQALLEKAAREREQLARQHAEATETLARQQANAAVALLRLGAADKVWPLLQHSNDPRRRSYLIRQLPLLGADPNELSRRLFIEPEVSSRRALLLALGEFSRDRLVADERERLTTKVLDLYRHDPDPGIHGAADWLLRKWHRGDSRQAIDQELASSEPQLAAHLEKRRWYVNGQGQTFAVIDPVKEFWMGSPPTEAGREGGPGGKLEARHKKRIGRTFAIASREVTVEQFLRFRKGQVYNRQVAPTPDCPVNVVTWYDAAAYCNWLSAKEGIDPEQWCYLPNSQGQFAEGMKIAPDYLKRIGYRLPSEAEWEYACRAGAATSRYFGETEELLPRYAWYTKNSLDLRMLPVGSLLPNDLGLFDMLGNALEWCHDPFAYYPAPMGSLAIEDAEHKEKEVTDSSGRMLRGGGFDLHSGLVRSSFRLGYLTTTRVLDAGFRPARTLKTE